MHTLNLPDQVLRLKTIVPQNHFQFPLPDFFALCSSYISAFKKRKNIDVLLLFITHENNHVPEIWFLY